MNPVISPPRASLLLWPLLLLGLSLAACDGDPAEEDAGPGDAGSPDAGLPDAGPQDAGLPDAGSPCDGPPGLYVEGSCVVLAEGIRPFSPRYTLWSDGAHKERFIYLPPGETIDTSDPDQWVFPEGTVIWKNFWTPEGLRLETRRLTKIRAGTGPGGWLMEVWVWNESQDGVLEVTGGQDNILGTDHDVPSQAQCLQCHNANALDPVLGFSAIQLNHASGEAEELNLEALNTEGLLSAGISEALATIPGSELQQEAMGYLHANCGECHREVMAPAGLRLWTDVGAGSLAETPLGMTAVNIPAGWSDGTVTHRIYGGDPSLSAISARMSLRDFNQMPPFATEVVDDEAVTLLNEWIATLPAP